MTENGLFDIFSNAHTQIPSILHRSHHHLPYEKQQEFNQGSKP